MKFMVSSPKKPENSPLYSVHIDLDSFILYNDEFTDEQELGNTDLNKIVEATNSNIMAALEMEENKRETLEQCVESKNQSEQNQDCK